jgi:CUG-BP- and ETR3-like factor
MESSSSEQKDPQTVVKKECDADSFKLFVGQIPRTYTEAECTKLFEEYGPVYQLNIHRDKSTGESKGCCFVTFYHRSDAMKAQGALHNIKVLPGMHNAMQVKPADLENRNERKLFVGMLSRTANEEDVRKMFESYGTIEEVTVLRENGKSKGCAFVTFVSRSCANQAIRQMNHSMTFEGCTKPMVVKLADTTKDKETKGRSDGQSPNGGDILQQLLQGNGLLPATNQMTHHLPTQLNTLGALLQNPSVAALLGTAPVLLQQQQHNQQILQQQQQYLELLKQQQQQQQQQAIFDPTTSQFFYPGVQQQQQQQSLSYQPMISPQTSILQQVAAFNNSMATPPIISTPGMSQNIMDPNLGLMQRSLPILSTGLVDPNALAAAAAAANSNNNSTANTSKGPEGCNLFIYHLPQEFGDEDLRSLFSHFGPVISAKVFIDKQTNLSKCFGFVSFDNALNAQKAIRGMNGFQIGAKRLKVQLKRDGEKPYDLSGKKSRCESAASST